MSGLSVCLCVSAFVAIAAALSAIDNDAKVEGVLCWALAMLLLFFAGVAAL